MSAPLKSPCISLGTNQRDIWRALKKEFKDGLINKSKQSNLYKVDDHTYVMVPDTIRYLVKERRDCHVASENGFRTCKTVDVRLPVVRNESTHYVALTQTLHEPIKMEDLWRRSLANMANLTYRKTRR